MRSYGSTPSRKGAVWTTPLLQVTNRLFTSAVVSPNGQMVAVLDSDATPWTLPVTGRQPKQVTGLNITNYTEFMAWKPC